MKLSQTTIKTLTRVIISIYLLFILSATAKSIDVDNAKKYIIDNQTSYYINNQTWETAPIGGDTIFIMSDRTKALRFQNINGSVTSPVVVINKGGQVKIYAQETWGAITFENCTHIKITGEGDPAYKYGFLLSAKSCGLAFAELSSACEAGFIHIDHEGFFGIFAKKDYGGNPPSPAPVFSNLSIHDCFIENVTEGMYIGETKSPGMEFRHVKIYNNIVKNTGRESIQIANAVEDVEVYNNTLLNAGLDKISFQSNILQIGDNTVANIYNNILIGAPSFGVIALGMGNIFIKNNYFSSCKGIFTDHRLFTVAGYPIQIENNYFKDLVSTEAVKNMNEINFLEISNNFWNDEIPFYKNNSGNNNNFILSNNQNVAVDAISFTDPDNNDYSLASETPEQYLKMGAPGGADTHIEDEPDTELISAQINLTPEMIVDEVIGGSYWSVNYLIDEQNCTPLNNLHPVSQSWKPFWNMDKGPYHVYIDLKSMHYVTNISLHDMHNTKNLVISTGEPGNWQPLFTEPCDKYIAWKQHTTNVSTRYIRLSMIESVFAAVNELVIFGYSEVDIIAEKSGNLESQLTVSTQYLENQSTQSILCQNPVENSLRLIIPQELCVDFTIEIIDIKGNPVFIENYPSINQSQLLIDLSRFNISNGIYLLKYLNKSGTSKTLKFIKNSY
jgi:hypothetical protein